MGQHIQTQTEWENEMAEKVLDYVKDALYLDFRYMSIALSALVPVSKMELTTMATDGSFVFFSREQMLRLFKKNDRYLNRLYLHTIFHCLFQHLWMRRQREPFLWNLACDIAVEYTIDSLKKDSTKRILSWIRQHTYEELEALQTGVSAAVIYRYLLGKRPEEWENLHQEFFADDHRFWPKEENLQVAPMETRSKWSKIARQTQMEKKKRGDAPQKGEQLFQSQIKNGKSRRTYRDFLQKFAIYREEMRLDSDEMDLIFYTYGLQHYGNLPLIEPMESREAKKIQDFVIVVDTSYSTSGDLVQSFLQETFEILSQRDSFFHRARLRIVQCDDNLQRVDVVENKEQLKILCDNFEVVGGGGTDFRPAFSYVDELRKQGEFENLCGLLYFTDGKGIYPKKKPDYKVAFLFLEDFEEEHVPAWAMRLKIEIEEMGYHEH